MGELFKYICYIPLTIIKIVLGLAGTVVLIPLALIAALFGGNIFDGFDGLWEWVFTYPD